MEQATKPQIAITANATPIVLTITDMRRKYREKKAMAKRLLVEEWFNKEFGSEDQWIKQHCTKQPYDKEP